ncbi:hypothetical protein M0R45_007479 [Rubus argutus]|uniref:Malectin-like domain-containing protein n=1 Tax=Rubus argutus TaxID=59490 RepID=A0AAW1Y0E7_RUBAR
MWMTACFIFSPPLHLSLFLHIIGSLVAGGLPPIYTLVDFITVNCGYSGNLFNKSDNRNWTGDIDSEFSPLERLGANSTSLVREAPPSSTVIQVPYATVRISRSEFTYIFPVTSGQKLIRLHFYPVSYADFDRSEALFSVKAGGYTLLKDFNVSAIADASRVEMPYKEFCVNIGEEKSLNITFASSRASPDSYVFINGIEIVSIPTNLYYSPAQSHWIEYIGGQINYTIENSTALEMVHRINIGGSPLSSNQDTGMYRNWDADDDVYLDDLSSRFSVIPSNTRIQLKFFSIPNYTAPSEVYQSGRSMGTNKTINKSYNLTWDFPVDSKFHYLVRLHFCEFQNQITSSGDRTFQIYIANQSADQDADIIQWSGGNGDTSLQRTTLCLCLTPPELEARK